MTVQTIADITPNSAAVPLAASGSPLSAWWIAITATGTTIRVGDSNVGSGRGLSIPSGATVVLPRISFDQQPYLLSQVCVYGTGSDKVSITYGA